MGGVVSDEGRGEGEVGKHDVAAVLQLLQCEWAGAVSGFCNVSGRSCVWLLQCEWVGLRLAFAM